MPESLRRRGITAAPEFILYIGFVGRGLEFAIGLKVKVEHIIFSDFAAVENTHDRADQILNVPRDGHLRCDFDVANQ